MQFKIDENLHADVADLLRQHGHDALTVYDQGMRSHSDEDIAKVCQREARALVTLDLDFADIRVFPPEDYVGFIVLRVADQSRPAVLRVMAKVIDGLTRIPPVSHLWIVDETHIRIRPGAQIP
jgi:predicted nuclease of predicted toxin-antitoxin system